MSYYDAVGFGGLLAITTALFLIGLLLKATGIARAFGGPLIAVALIAFIILALAGLIRVRRNR